MVEGMTVRERAQRAVKDELTLVSQDLFLRKGYDATTVDDLAAVAGMSRRTFFRYFASKDDVILGKYDIFSDAIEIALHERPATESTWIALRRSFDVVVDHFDDPAKSERAVQLHRMILGNPSLTSGELVRMSRLQNRLAAVLRKRVRPLRHDPDDPRFDVLAGAALACLKVATSTWTASNGSRPLQVILDQAMSVLTPTQEHEQPVRFVSDQASAGAPAQRLPTGTNKS